MARIIIAPDSFKESLDSAKVARHISNGIKRVWPETEIIEVPLSDGGEGLLKIMAAADGGQIIVEEATGPLGLTVSASYGLLGDGQTAVIEMAEASGLALVPPGSRNPMKTTTFGTGELIRAALDRGCRRIIVGIGGSATNDGGAGMAQALGVKLLDDRGGEIGPGAEGLLSLNSIDITGLDDRIGKVEIMVACDVDNIFHGPEGAACVYGPQKGAGPEMVAELDRALEHLSAVIQRDLGIDISHLPGAGAAGGLGGGLVAFLGGKMNRGSHIVFEILKFEELLAEGADLVITGEGEINGQSVYGKVPVAVARLAKKRNLPVLALVGSIGPGAEKVYSEGIDAIMSIVPRPISLEEAMGQAAVLLEDAAERAVRIMGLFRNI
ncbi:MAG: glycerate kinase [Bacillota bacterium]